MPIDMTSFQPPPSQLVFLATVERDGRGPVVGFRGRGPHVRLFRPALTPGSDGTRIVEKSIVQAELFLDRPALRLYAVGVGVEEWSLSVEQAR